MNKIKNHIASKIYEHREQINEWFKVQFQNNVPPFYCSVDIRDSGEKVAPVDSNLFPAGFNNICEVDFENASHLFKIQMVEMAEQLKVPAPKKILIIPENHTENRFYLENLYCLKTILEEADFEVEIGWYTAPDAPALAAPLTLVTASEKTIVAYPIEITSTGILQTKAGFSPDWVILNNDFSQGYPKEFEKVKQAILPGYRLGWHTRKKSAHFIHYNALATEFANMIGLEPWHLTIESQAVGPVDFNEGLGLNEVIDVSEKMFAKLKNQYKEHGLTREPALFVKNDAGTYGMGIMVIHSIDELKNMNRRTKNKMSMGKNKSHIDQVIIQEGVPTQLMTDGHSSEPVIYMMGHELIGGFIRANTQRDDLDNLNSQGMIFKKLCFKDLHDSWDCGNVNDFPILESVYGSVAKLSALAAAKEIQEINAKGKTL